MLALPFVGYVKVNLQEGRDSKYQHCKTNRILAVPLEHGSSGIVYEIYVLRRPLILGSSG